MKIVFVLSFFVLFQLVFAESITCENEEGHCTFEKDVEYECFCPWGIQSHGTIYGELPTMDECLEKIYNVCGHSCSNDAGRCRIDEKSFRCYCSDGRIEKGSEEKNLVCEMVLVNKCGTERPDINNLCNEEQLTFCTDPYFAFFEKCKGLVIPDEKIEELKNGTWNAFGDDIAGCCREYQNAENFIIELVDCIKTETCELCVAEYNESTGNISDEDRGSADTGDTGDVVDAGNTVDTGDTTDVTDTADTGDTVDTETQDESNQNDQKQEVDSTKSSSACSVILI